MDEVFSKFKEVLYSVLPITLIVIVLNFTLSPVATPLIIRFIIGAVLIIIGLTIFLIGVDIGITPIGNTMGSTMAKSNKLWIVILAGILLGFFVSIAEPDLHILAGQVAAVTSGLIAKNILVVIVSIGIAVFLSIGLTRIVLNFPIHKLLTLIYAVILILAFMTSPEFLAISFDASGATTGALTVPFILALAVGVSKLKKHSQEAEKDSFGLVGIASAGAIISVMAMSIISKTDKVTGNLPQQTVSDAIVEPFLHIFPIVTGEVIVSLLPIVITFLIFQRISFKLSKRNVRKILFGTLFTLIGLVLFLVGVNAGFMNVGSTVGYNLASLDSKAYVIILAFVLGFVTILAEPAVYVLTHQIEDVTSGYVKRPVVLITLAIGVGIAVALSIIRILIPELQLWQYLLPGYMIALALMYFVPTLFVGMAFDSGGVASGPMTATFILAYSQGVAEAIPGANVLTEGFGMIAMVAMTPVISLQILGLIFKLKSKKGEMES